MRDDGQAPSRAITSGRRLDRVVDELIGICRGLLADGALVPQEVVFLRGWLARQGDMVHEYPLRNIAELLDKAPATGIIDSALEALMLDATAKLVGGEVSAPETSSLASVLPICVPPPNIIYEERRFVATGKFAFGTREAVEGAIASRGGETASSVNKKTDFLVIGTIGSRDWIHSSFGRKIQQAVELRGQGLPISIVAEEHWRRSL